MSDESDRFWAALSAEARAWADAKYLCFHTALRYVDVDQSVFRDFGVECSPVWNKLWRLPGTKAWRYVPRPVARDRVYDAVMRLPLHEGRALTAIDNAKVRQHFLHLARKAGLATDVGTNNQLIRFGIMVALEASPKLTEVFGPADAYITTTG